MTFYYIRITTVDGGFVKTRVYECCIPVSLTVVIYVIRIDSKAADFGIFAATTRT